MQRFILSIPTFWLIYHMFTLGVSHSMFSGYTGESFAFLASIGALETFTMWRNAFYLGYGLILLAMGIQIVTKPKNSALPAFTSSVISSVVTAIIFTTFSYAIAAMLLDAYKLMVQ